MLQSYQKPKLKRQNVTVGSKRGAKVAENETLQMLSRWTMEYPHSSPVNKKVREANVKLSAF